MLINIAIDGYSASGKTSLGKLLSEKLEYIFVDSGYFYRYFANIGTHPSLSSILELISTYEIENSKNFIDNLNKVIEDADGEEYLEQGRKASIIAQDPDIRKAITGLIRNLTIEKGFVVTGRDATTNILPDAEVKIVIDTKLEKRVKRRAEQMNLTEEETLNDLFRRDIKSFDLIKEAKRVSKEIDTTNLNIEESLEEIMKYVL